LRKRGKFFLILRILSLIGKNKNVTPFFFFSENGSAKNLAPYTNIPLHSFVHSFIHLFGKTNCLLNSSWNSVKTLCALSIIYYLKNWHDLQEPLSSSRTWSGSGRRRTQTPSSSALLIHNNSIAMPATIEHTHTPKTHNPWAL